MSNESKRARSPDTRTILIPSPMSSPQGSPVASSQRVLESTVRKRVRANESPLTFIRASGGAVSPISRHGWVERVLFLGEESLACLNSESGRHYRECVYALLPMRAHEQFDTMAIRAVRTYFTNAELGDDENAPTVVVPRENFSLLGKNERSYLLLLREAEQPVAQISIEHAVEELLERCPFLRDPGTTWICRPDRLHVLLATTTHESDACKAVIQVTLPIELKLHKFVWRRQGTLWAQWHCTQGNIDRLRSDLRISSGGAIAQCFTPSPEEDPTLSRPFAVETLVMAVLLKPSREEFATLKIITAEMERMFEGVTARFAKVTRVSQIHDRLDREGTTEESFPMHPTQPPQTTFLDRVDFGLSLVRTSPTVRRIVLGVSFSVACSVGLVFLVKKIR